MAEPDTTTGGKVASACNECRRKRAKCDGELPCSRCASRPGLECAYEPHLRQTKEVIQAELIRLRGERRKMDSVLELLKTQHDPGVILNQLRSGQPLEWVASSGHGQALSENSSLSPNTALSSGSAVTESSGSITRVNSSSPQSTMTANLHPWTAVTHNDGLINHLLALYFCWEYPTFASLSKEHFMHDFSSGSTKFCSSLLVNAILALGAKSSDVPEARKDPSDPRSAGDHFFEEAKRLLGSEEVPTLTTIQALGLMSLRQASCGKDASSFFYARQSLRMALDIDLHRQHPASRENNPTTISSAEHEVRTATFWGCFNLEQAWSLCIERPSQVIPGQIEIPKPEEVKEIENEDWRPLTDAGLTSPNNGQLNNVRSVYRCFSELSEIINEGAFQVYARSQQLESHSLLSTYQKLLEWYEALPDQLRLGRNFTPTVLFTHMYYHFAVLILFRPFKDLSIPNSKISPAIICSEAAQNLFVLIKSYKDLYTLRRIPSFVPYMVLTANLAYLVDLALGAEEVADEAAKLASLLYLEEMASSHEFCRRALEIVDYFSQLWGVDTQNNDAVHLIRQKLQGDEKLNHPANGVSGSDTFFLPTGNCSTNQRPEGFEMKNFLTAGTTMSLFPQQGSQIRRRLSSNQTGDDMEE